MRRIALACLVSVGLCAGALAGPQAQAPQPKTPVGQPKAQPKTQPKAQPKTQPKAQPKNAAAEQAGERIGDWSLICRKTKAEAEAKENAKDTSKKSKDKAKDEAKDKKTPEQCSVEQILVNQDNKNIAFYLAVGYGPRGNLVLAVRTPVGLALGRGLEVSFGGQAVQRVRFSTCHGKGCEAVLILSPALQQEMRKAERALITVHGWNGGTLQASPSLEGFGAALDALNKRRGAS